MKAVLLDSDDFDSKGGDSRDVEVKLEFQIPFEIDTKYFSDQVKDEDGYTASDDDVIVRGPVYVGNSEMLDRHNELVAPDAILAAWNNYAKNPVILYNHSKDSGVIGKMLDVEMGEWDGIEGSVPIGRALIDGGEKSIVRKIRKGLLRAFSIGFIARAAVKECKDDDTCYLTFTEIDWLETSVVDVPASPNALFNVEKHIIGYEDMGDAIAILFEKEMEESPSEEPPTGGDIESPVEESAKSSCGCGGKHIESDTPTEAQPANDEIAELREELDALKAILNDISDKSKSQKSESGDTDSLNTPIDESLGQPKGNNTMTDDTILESEATEEVLVEGAEISEPVIEEPALNVKSEEVEATEVAAEELPEEVVEEVAEATEEESSGEPTSTEVLFEVVKVLSKVEGRLSDIENHIKSSEDIDTLKSELESMKAEKEAAEAEAKVEAEVAKRVAALVGEVPSAPSAEANPKSLSSTGVKVENKSVTRHDPTPAVSKGMNGLAGWLESQIASRGQ